MEFTGAVLVCNKKITSAIENYREKDKYYNQKYEEGKQRAIDEVDTWASLLSGGIKIRKVANGQCGRIETL